MHVLVLKSVLAVLPPEHSLACIWFLFAVSLCLFLSLGRIQLFSIFYTLLSSFVWTATYYLNLLTASAKLFYAEPFKYCQNSMPQQLHDNEIFAVFSDLTEYNQWMNYAIWKRCIVPDPWHFASWFLFFLSVVLQSFFSTQSYRCKSVPIFQNGSL